jgi:hypothetical protein
MRLKRTALPGYEVIEYRHLTQLPQLGAIIETAMNKKAIRARVVHGPELGEYIIYLDEVEN